jgi:hypothetical protein
LNARNTHAPHAHTQSHAPSPSLPRARHRQTLAQDPPLRRLVLADNSVGLEGAAALAGALATNGALAELDLSANEFDDAAAGALADATRRARGLRRLVLLGNKIPFSLETLRLLMEVIGAHVCVCVCVVWCGVVWCVVRVCGGISGKRNGGATAGPTVGGGAGLGWS